MTSNKAKVGIISSVTPGIFKDIANQDMFSEEEREQAIKDELKVFTDRIQIDYLKENVQFELIRALEWIPSNYTADAYILGWSPHMVTDDKEWIRELETFIHKEVDAGKPVLWICFWHQVLAKAFGGEVDYIPERWIGNNTIYLNDIGKKDDIFSNMNEKFEALWSHRQAVINPGEAVVLGNNSHSKNQIIKIGENAWGVQFHPEFTASFMSFLTKLMNDSLTKENINVQELLQELQGFELRNDGSKVIQLFLNKYFS